MKNDSEYEMWRSAISGGKNDDEESSESKPVRQIRHMSVNIEGFLRNAGTKDLSGIFSDDDGYEMTDSEARSMLKEALADGWKKIPCGDCDGFDHFGGGCSGHPIKDNTIQ